MCHVPRNVPLSEVEELDGVSVHTPDKAASRVLLFPIAKKEEDETTEVKKTRDLFSTSLSSFFLYS